MKNEIPAYNNQEEKKKFFTLEIIDTEDKFRELFEIILPQKFKQGGIWRGLSESRYKLYNSLQRENVIKEELISIKDVISRIEDSTAKLAKWNRGVVRKYFRNNHKLQNVPIYAALSILQHHGCKTPFIDFTRSPNVALYFATNSDNPQWKTIINKILTPINTLKKSVNIKNYFSIYFIDSEHPYVKFNSEIGVELLISENKTSDEINVYFNNNDNIIKSIFDFPIQCINDKEYKIVNHYTMSNYNITAQDGLFILNADPFLPLEESIIQRINDLACRESYPKVDHDIAIVQSKENFICYDIHKKLIPKIFDALNSEKINITKETMEPDFKKLKDDITFEKITKATIEK